jgi:caa(3)-type oxidase subunit IV
MADAHHAAAHGTGHDGHHEEHIHEVSHYRNVYFALVVLFLISVAGPAVGIWWLTLITAFGIAVVKASLVIKYFMHLDTEQRFVHYFLLVSLLFMFLFFFAVAPDVMNHHGTNWQNVAAKAEVERGLAAGDGHGGHGGGGEHGGGEGGEAAHH